MHIFVILKNKPLYIASFFTSLQSKVMLLFCLSIMLERSTSVNTGLSKTIQEIPNFTSEAHLQVWLLSLAERTWIPSSHRPLERQWCTPLEYIICSWAHTHRWGNDRMSQTRGNNGFPGGWKDLIYFATVSPLKVMVQPETEMHTIFSP